MDKLTKYLIAILICLAIIAIKPVPQAQVGSPTLSVPNEQTVFPLGDNRMAIVETNNSSGMFGTILVLEYDEAKGRFKLVGQDNYADYFHNPQKYGLK